MRFISLGLDNFIEDIEKDFNVKSIAKFKLKTSYDIYDGIFNIKVEFRHIGQDDAFEYTAKYRYVEDFTNDFNIILEKLNLNKFIK